MTSSIRSPVPMSRNVSDRKLPERLTLVFDNLKAECRKMIGQSTPLRDGVSCPRDVDLWGGCWPDTPAGTVANITCPPIPSFNTEGHAHLECTMNGSWSIDTDTGNKLVNYTDCLSETDSFEEGTRYVYIYIGGFSFSLVMLLLSLAIFLRFKQLRCDRIKIHVNLFLSYLFTGVSWILYFVLVTLDGKVLIENPLWCRMLHVLCQYFLVCNFLWMFCEGLYLNTIIMCALTVGRKLLIFCYVIGWGVSFFLVSIYTAVRSYQSIETNLLVGCWLEESSYQYIMYGPVIASLIINALFLVNIVRLLLSKLRRLPDATQTKKATRATLILVPLLGLQYVLIPFRPPSGTVIEEIYHVAVALLTSLQGAFVSIMYCFLNGEVISVMTRKYRQRKLMHKRSSIRSTTGQNGGYTTVDQFQMQHLNWKHNYQKVAFEMECTLSDGDRVLPSQ
ncbi:hypothetical protein DPMN_181859 [Dreissena polymorpha]|uniref:Uncharacterized protein n=1 Tax=Dreissena polymorpha TaxID=45954 RepID=A0A9D4I5N8_DREPO|nr:hypothetical protein DPMN_181859 [Dreissena polymorpha]